MLNLWIFKDGSHNFKTFFFGNSLRYDCYFQKVFKPQEVVNFDAT